MAASGRTCLFNTVDGRLACRGRPLPATPATPPTAPPNPNDPLLTWLAVRLRGVPRPPSAAAAADDDPLAARRWLPKSMSGRRLKDNEIESENEIRKIEEHNEISFERTFRVQCRLPATRRPTAGNSDISVFISPLPPSLPQVAKNWRGGKDWTRESEHDYMSRPAEQLGKLFIRAGGLIH